MKPENIIVIAADHLRYDVLGKGYTPHLDALAAESLRYQEAYCASPLCVPARGSLFTGLCPNSTGSLINPWVAEDAHAGLVREGISNLYGLMEEAGWECLHSGKQHLFTAGGKPEERADTKVKWLSTEKTYREFLKKEGKRMPGGTRFRSLVPEMVGRSRTLQTTCSNASTGCYEEGEAYYFDNYFTDELIKGMRVRDKSKPLFLSAMYLAPHPPFDIPEPWYSKYAPEDVRLPDNVGVFYPHQSPLQLYNVTGVLGAHYTRDEWAESWRAYLGLVSLLDTCVGRILEELKQEGIYENSLILFTSDHGEMLGSHRLFQKMCMYQESVKVPLYLRLPQGRSGDIPQTVSHIDVLPTLCQLLELTPAHRMEGRILPGIFPGTGAQSVPAFIQYDGNGSLGGYQRCVVSDGRKLILDVFKDERFFELYDVRNDPQETENLLFRHEEVTQREAEHLFSLLLRHMRDTRDTLQCEEDALKQFIGLL